MALLASADFKWREKFKPNISFMKNDINALANRFYLAELASAEETD